MEKKVDMKGMKRKIEALLASSKPIEPEDARECMQFMYDTLGAAATDCGDSRRKLAMAVDLLEMTVLKGMPEPIKKLTLALLDVDVEVKVQTVDEETFNKVMAEKVFENASSSTVH